LANNAEHLRRSWDAMLGTFKEIIGENDMPTMVEVWKAEGEVKARREMVLKALRKKFKQVPQEIEDAVLSRSDPIALESLLEHVFDCNSLEEFAEGL